MPDILPGVNTLRDLVNVAVGRQHAETVIHNGQWVCVQTGEILPHSDIAIIKRRIAYVGPDASHTIGAGTRVIDAQGKYLVPGLLDAHMHVESGMLTITGFVRAVIPHGTTGIFIDPHEIANVLGLDGVRLMVDEAGQQPIHVFVQMPSCVPAAPGFETSGAVIGPAEIAEAMTWPRIIGLGEMMNFPGVVNVDEKVMAELGATRLSRKVIGGHYASPDLGLPFHGYAAGGAQDDHEGTRAEDAVMRARAGMRVMMRFGSAWQDVAAQVKAILETGQDPRRFILCTDDSHSQTLVSEGHMDRVLRHAMDQGLSPMQAIQMATINTAEHFGVSQELGMIAPGRFADILVIPDLRKFEVDTVIARGKVIGEKGKVLIEFPIINYPTRVTHSVNLKKKMKAGNFCLPSSEEGEVTANVIGVIENQAPTQHLKIKMMAKNGEVKASLDDDIAKVAVIERHRGLGGVSVGLVTGFGFNEQCAIASTVAHDSHNLLVVGTDDEAMALAANCLAECDGGQIVIKDGIIIGKVELPIAGLMSSEPAEEVARKVETVLKGFRSCGCRLNNPNMQLSLLALVVIPELRISDKGLVDVAQFKFIPVLE